MGTFYSQFGPLNGRFAALNGALIPDEMAIFAQTAPVNITNTAAETTIFTTGIGSLVIQPGYIQLGTTIKIHIIGFVSSTASPTLDIRTYFGATKVLDTGAATYGNYASATPFTRDIILSFTAVGTSGSVTAMDYGIVYAASPSSFAGITPATTTAINTTIQNTLNFTYQWGTASGSNTILVESAVVEIIG